MEKMDQNKILFYISSLQGGGAERVLVTLANAFSAQNKQVAIATYSDSDVAYHLNSNIRLFHMEDESKPKITRSIINRLYFRIWKFKRIRKITKLFKPDLVLSFVTPTNNDVVFSLLGTGIPVVVCEHTNVLRSYSAKTTFYRKLIYPFASAITVLTRHDYLLWRKKYRQVVYMPNPISTEETALPPSEREKTVLAVGTVLSWKIKGFDNLLVAWGKLCQRFLDWKLKIAGKGDEKSMKYLQSIIDKHHCSNVEFLGFRNDIHDLMQKSAIFCLSSRVEGLPMVLIEAMSCGCCCVAFDCTTGPREIIKPGSGLLVKNQDIDDLVDKLSFAMENPVERESFASKAPESVSQYALDRIVARWQILIDKIMK